jgi:hypothetical protein
VPSTDDVIKVVQEAVRQFGEDTLKWVDVLPAIVLSDDPPKIRVISKVQVTSDVDPRPTLKDHVRLSHDVARKWARSSTVCVETWDGYITIDGERSDAILCNYWVEGRGPIFFAQRYRRNPFEWIGPAIPGEETTPAETSG